jgi:hypothetical protein
MSTKKEKKLGGEDRNRKDQQKPAHDAVTPVGTPRRTGKAAAIAENAVAVIVSSDPAPPKPAKAPKKAKSPATDEPATPPDDAGEIVVFAFRLTRTERDELHAATGSAKASRFVKAIVLAGARGDLKAVTELMEEAQASRK